MYAPGLDIELVQALGLNRSVQRTCINFMGCYAAMNALKLADAFCQADAGARVLIVCAELCTLHFQKSASKDDLVSNALFGDGAAAVLVQAQPATSGPSLALEAFHCGLQPEGAPDMAWHINDFGFEMTLSSYVPSLIQQGIRQLTDELLARLPVELADIQHFAIHPGGRKILETIETELDLTRYDNRFAYGVLRDYGNMSSATVLFVLRDLLRTLTPAQAGDAVLSFAFGPGLTLEALLLKVHSTPEAVPVLEAENAEGLVTVADYV
jgi:alpha-pyrone synthase